MTQDLFGLREAGGHLDVEIEKKIEIWFMTIN